MYRDGKLLIGKGENESYLLLKMANRHGLIAGATGTGKTTTLKVMAESFSRAGVPVFLADIKGDLAGMIAPGTPNENVTSRVESMGLTDYTFTSFPTRFWDVYGEKGHAVRATVSDIGPILLSRILDLNDTQTGVLSIAFRVADEKGWDLIDIKDMRAMLQYVSNNSKELSGKYGSISRRSVNAILRSLLVLEDRGGNYFLGEPMLDVKDWMQTSYDGKGFINVLHCEQLFQTPLLYSTFLLWMLSELYELLPEVGDLDKPKMVFFFDEAHLLFEDAPKVLLQKIEQVVRLIRSKGVGVYFITQSPMDIPDSVLAQLNNRIQHALRAYTPAEQKKVKTAADTFRQNPAFNTAEVISELKTGEALISFLDEKGAPCVVERAKILPPQSRMGTITDEERANNMANSGMGKYDEMVDNISAYEILNGETDTGIKELEAIRVESEETGIVLTVDNTYSSELEKQLADQQKEYEKQRQKELTAREKRAEKEAQRKQKELEKTAAAVIGTVTTSVFNSTLRRSVSKKNSALENAFNQTFNNVGRKVGRQLSKEIARGILGTISK